jgi:photosystem II stability/assembly factor-like uncharacterized protein
MKPTLLLIPLFLFSFAEQADSQWVQSKGSLRENVACFAVSGTDLLAGTREGGVYLTIDSGASWNKLGGYTLDNKTVNALAISGSNFIAATSNGIYLSTNQGANWTQEAITGTTYALMISGTNLFAGTIDGLYFSTDKGISWTETSLSKVAISSLAVSGATMFAGTGKGGFRSIDNGINWTHISDFGLLSEMSLAVSGENLFAAPAFNGIYRSTDNGISWNQMDTVLTTKNINSLTMSGSNLFASTDRGLFLSSNYGESWGLVSGSSRISYVGSLDVLGSNWFAGTPSGVFHSSNNGTTWAQDSEMSLNSIILALTVSGTNLFTGSYTYIVHNGDTVDGGVFHSTDQGKSWRPTNLIHKNIYSLTANNTNLFAGTDSGVFFSTDDAKNWTQAGLTQKHINTFAVSGSNIYACTDSGVFLTMDNGTSWIQKGLNNIQVNAFAVLDTHLYAGTNKGLFLSIDNGKSWLQTGLSNTALRSLALLGTDLFAGSSYGTGGIHLSTDYGSSWKTVNNGLPNNGNISVISFIAYGTNLFIGTESYGVFLSNDSGRNWKNAGLDYSVRALDILGSNIYAGTYGNSVWRRPLSEMIAVNNVKASPDINRPFTLEQNTPNPFDATTKITFDLDRNAFVSLKIFDILGREVSVLASEELPAGSYTRNWNAPAFSPGEYFYRLQTGAYSETRKLVLVK